MCVKFYTINLYNNYTIDTQLGLIKCHVKYISKKDTKNRKQKFKLLNIVGFLKI